ncbi:MAG: hypothetical protein KGJ35_00455 [Patescibacteria group bacterium]|nr:hypothetical protein [Patescibacteria group bacterium]
MKSFTSEIIVTLLLIALAALLWNPYWMPMGLLYALIVCFIVVFGGFAAFIWRENGGDERDVLIRHVAARFAYLSGALVMAVGVIYEALARHMLDPWLAVAFIVTVLGKVAGFVYGKGRY